MDVLQSRLTEIFNEAQNGFQYHKKKLEELEDVFENRSLSLVDFYEIFFELVKHVLATFERHPATERLVGFIAKFAVAVAPKRSKVKEDESDSSSDEDDDMKEEEIMNNFTHMFLMKLISHSQAQDKAVRFRSTLIIAKILDQARDDPLVKIHSTILDEISEQLMGLLYDRIAVVRTQAAHALSFYQDPNDAECHITNALGWSLVNDTSSDVRRCLVKNLVLTKNTLGLVIGRTRDISEDVRKTTYHILAEKCTIRHLKIEQRIKLMSDGLRDRSSAVKKACLNGLLRSWLFTLDGDLFELLRRLDLESSPDLCDTVLMNLFEDLPDESLLKYHAMQEPTNDTSRDQSNNQSMDGPSNDQLNGQLNDQSNNQSNETVHSCTIPYGNLEPEVAFYWKAVCKYFKTKYDKTKDPKVLEHLEYVAPTLSNFCEYIENCFAQVSLIPSDDDESHDSHVTNEFMMCELCGIFQYLDFSDEVGRRHLGKLVHTVLTNRRVPPSIVSPLLSMQKSIWPRESFRVEKMLEMISEVRYPSISDASHDNRTTISEGSIADDLSHLDLKEDSGSLLKCLAVATEIFAQLKMGKLSPSLQTLVESLLFPCIKNENPYVRDMAVNALGRACLVDIELARTNILLFIQACCVDLEFVKATALKVVFDLLHLFGVSAFSETGEQQTTSNEKSQEAADEGAAGSDPPPSSYTPPSSPVSPFPSSSSSPPSTISTTPVNEANQKFLHILGKFLDENSALLRGVAVEGLVKLLLCGRVMSIKLLTRLFITWYNPAHQKDTRVKGVLSVFFSEYAGCGHECRSAIAECFLPLLKTIYEAPEASPLHKIDPSNLTLFVLKLSAPIDEEEDSPHDSLALSVANYLLSGDDMSCDRKWCQVLCKSLNQMSLTKSNKSFIEDMIALIGQLEEDIKDRSSRTCLKNFKASLTKNMLNLPDPPPSSDETLMEGVANSDVPAEGVVNNEVSDETLMEGVVNNGVTEADQDDTDNINRSSTISPSHIANIIASAKASSRKKKNRKRKSKSGSYDPANATTNTTNGAHEDSDEDDIGLLGEHSPFVKDSRTKNL